MGAPVGVEFVANATTAGAQGRPSVAFGPDGESAIAWTGDAALPADAVDVYVQVYDASGAAIGGELRVNTATPGFQDRPTVRFLPDPDSEGNTQFLVSWRDVADSAGVTPNGTGAGYKCYAIEDQAIFDDGFESGDTASWSSSTE